MDADMMDEEFDQEMDDWDAEEREDLDIVSFVCEDCDYRWEEPAAEEVDTDVMVCPMCGSVNVTQL